LATVGVDDGSLQADSQPKSLVLLDHHPLSPQRSLPVHRRQGSQNLFSVSPSMLSSRRAMCHNSIGECCCGLQPADCIIINHMESR